jgi:hypothetical protein
MRRVPRRRLSIATVTAYRTAGGMALEPNLIYTTGRPRCATFAKDEFSTKAIRSSLGKPKVAREEKKKQAVTPITAAVTDPHSTATCWGIRTPT